MKLVMYQHESPHEAPCFMLGIAPPVFRNFWQLLQEKEKAENLKKKMSVAGVGGSAGNVLAGASDVTQLLVDCHLVYRGTPTPSQP